MKNACQGTKKEPCSADLTIKINVCYVMGYIELNLFVAAK